MEVTLELVAMVLSGFGILGLTLWFINRNFRQRLPTIRNQQRDTNLVGKDGKDRWNQIKSKIKGKSRSIPLIVSPSITDPISVKSDDQSRSTGLGSDYLDILNENLHLVSQKIIQKRSSQDAKRAGVVKEKVQLTASEEEKLMSLWSITTDTDSPQAVKETRRIADDEEELDRMSGKKIFPTKSANLAASVSSSSLSVPLINKKSKATRVAKKDSK